MREIQRLDTSHSSETGNGEYIDEQKRNSLDAGCLALSGTQIFGAVL